MRRLFGIWGVAILLMVSQLAHGQDRRRYGPPSGPQDCACYNGRIFMLVAGSSSDSIDVSEKVDNATDGTACPIKVKSINWATTDSNLANYRSQTAQIMGAAMIVQEVQKIRRCNPNACIVLLGYCAGTRVVLVAAEQLPPGSIDRIILLAPSVSSCYDPRGALRASRCGMDVFYDPDDNVLEFKETEWGTADGMKNMTTAGRTGFLIAKGRVNDPCLCNLRQTDVNTYGLGCGHCATLGYLFMRRNILPLVTACCGQCGQGCGPAPAPPAPVPPPPPPPGYNPPTPPAYNPPVPPPGPSYGPAMPRSPGRTPQGPSLPPLPPPPAPGPLPPPQASIVNPYAPPVLPPPVLSPQG